MSRRPLRLVVVVVLATAGCSLPLSPGVHPVGDAPAVQRPGLPLQVIPPGPKPGDTPVGTVLGFLGAEASSDGHHAIARQFLTPGASTGWKDDAQVEVYDPDELVVTQEPGATASATTVRVTAKVTALVRPDGSYVVTPGSTVVEEYPLVRKDQQWLLASAPPGLLLTEADRGRLFSPESIYYLAPVAPGSAPHVVPDQVFLPVGGDLATTLVSRMLEPPSAALAGSVWTAVPPRTSLRSVTQSVSGVVTVDLVGAETLSGSLAQSFSAQLAWTLRGLGPAFRGLRVLMDGRSLDVPGVGVVQDPDQWVTYDAEGEGTSPPYFFVSKRRLAASVDLPAGPATAGEPGDGHAIAVDAVAVTPDRVTAALLETGPGGLVTVRTGLLRGTSFPVVARATGLRSPSWGSGERGLWLLRGDRGVALLSQGLHPVMVDGLPAGHLDGLAVARDGVRIALLVGGGVYVGRIVFVGATPHVVGLTAILPLMHQARQVVWESGTELVVLGRLTRSVQVVRVAVDGSSSETLNTAGLVPTEIAASPGGVIVVSGQRLYLLTSGVFRQVQPDAASAVVYPG